MPKPVCKGYYKYKVKDYLEKLSKSKIQSNKIRWLVYLNKNQCKCIVIPYIVNDNNIKDLCNGKLYKIDDIDNKNILKSHIKNVNSYQLHENTTTEGILTTWKLDWLINGQSKKELDKRKEFMPRYYSKWGFKSVDFEEMREPTKVTVKPYLLKSEIFYLKRRTEKRWDNHLNSTKQFTKNDIKQLEK